MNRLKELRIEKGLRENKKLSQKELAETIGVHYRTLQNWESGENQIKPDKAQVLADYFGVNVGYLLGYDKEPILTMEEHMIRSGMADDGMVFYNGEKLSEHLLQLEQAPFVRQDKEQEIKKSLSELSYQDVNLVHALIKRLADK